jgi:hypothetical protein
LKIDTRAPSTNVSSAYVQRQRKTLPYTITPIKDLKQWKAERAQAESDWQGRQAKVRAEARSRAVSMVENQTPAAAPTTAEREEIRYLSNLSKPKRPYIAPPTLVCVSPAPKLSRFLRFKAFCRQKLSEFWRSAFPES